VLLLLYHLLDISEQVAQHTLDLALRQLSKHPQPFFLHQEQAHGRI